MKTYTYIKTALWLQKLRISDSLKFSSENRGVKQDLKIEVPQEFFGVKRWECEVVSNENVATFIKELVLRLPEDEEVNFRAGGYVQFEIPPYDICYKDMIIEEEYQPDWKKFGVFDNKSKVDDVTIRAYSMANYPEEKGIMKFNIRVASPPPGSDFPPGKMSSYLFTLKPGDKVTIFGPSNVSTDTFAHTIRIFDLFEPKMGQQRIYGHFYACP